MAPIELDVWVDLMCPVCYVAKRRLEAAVAASAHPSEVSVTYRSFELDPLAARGADGGVAQQLARIQDVTEEQAMVALEAIAIDARPDGIVMDLAAMRPANTLDAHRVLALGRATGGLALQSAVLERLYAAQFAEGKAVDDPAVLLRLGAEAGVDERLLAAVLSSDEYADEVRSDEGAAAELGITAVPFILTDGQIASSGLQTIDGFSRLLGITSGRM